jgi:superfamily I DNA and/or RNA helicase
LTRAQDSLWLIGDPGTLARRSLWSGPLDHLDENGAARERQVIGKLVGYLQGEGRHPETFHLL